MVYRGHVKDGVVALEDGAPLPEGAKVTVQLLEEAEEGIYPEIARFSGILPPHLDIKDFYVQGLMDKHQ